MELEQILISENDMAKDNAQALLKEYGVPFTEAGKLIIEGKKISVTEESDIKGMQNAREIRLKLRDERISIERRHTELKKDINSRGRAIDLVKRTALEKIKPTEDHLMLQEKYAELQQKNRAEKLKQDRADELFKYTNDISIYNFDDMNKEQFDNLLLTVKNAYNDKIELLRKEEEERRLKLEAEKKHQAEIEAENIRLKKEAEAAETERAAERKAEQEKLDKIQAEKDAEIKAEREKREAIEAEQRRLNEVAKKTKLDAEQKEQSALLAPDKEKLIHFAKAIDSIRSQKLPAVKSNQAQVIINETDSMLDDISIMIIAKSSRL
jgi:colicin import membrane protein